MELKEIDWKGVFWIAVAQDKGQWCDLVSTAVNLCIP
jgi:hypothetical protein